MTLLVNESENIFLIISIDLCIYNINKDRQDLWYQVAKVITHLQGYVNEGDKQIDLHKLLKKYIHEDRH